MTDLEQLEQEGNDDFHLLDLVGPMHFSTGHLLELHAQAHQRLVDYDRRHHINLLIAATILGWLVAFIFAYTWNNIWLAMGAVLGLLLSLIACISGVFLLVKMYKSRQDLEYNIRIIESELKKR